MSDRILSVGSAFPTFTKKAVVSIESGKEFGEITSEDHKNAKKMDGDVLVSKRFHFCMPY